MATVHFIQQGKGGVGKSMVTSQLAVTMQRRGYRTAVLDADITGCLRYRPGERDTGRIQGI